MYNILIAGEISTFIDDSERVDQTYQGDNEDSQEVRDTQIPQKNNLLKPIAIIVVAGLTLAATIYGIYSCITTQQPEELGNQNRDPEDPPRQKTSSDLNRNELEGSDQYVNTPKQTPRRYSLDSKYLTRESGLEQVDLRRYSLDSKYLKRKSGPEQVALRHHSFDDSRQFEQVGFAEYDPFIQPLISPPQLPTLSDAITEDNI